MEEFDALNAVLAKPDWETQLEERFISIKWDENQEYVLFKYSQLFSDFNDPVVRACRGIIYDTTTTPFTCVCAPFIKFGNYGEAYCPEIDWHSARVLEKIDGSLMKIWYYKGNWHLSTNGTVDAYKAEVNDFLTFGELFEKALMDQFGKTFNEFVSHLTPNFTYMFELTAPENRVIIEYKERKIWYLSRRDMLDMREDYINDTEIERPKQYSLSSLYDCLSLVSQMKASQEGVVVNDGYFNRVKIKSPEYLMACHLVNNRVITTKRILMMIKDLTIDDFLAYCSEYSEQVEKIQQILADKAKILNDAWDKVKEYSVGAGQDENHYHDLEKRKIFAEKVSHYPKEKGYLFKKCDNPKLTADSYILMQRLDTLKTFVNSHLKN